MYFFPLDYPKERRLKLLVKWAGGKEKELKYIIPNLPKTFQNYYEPFVGGGAVYTAICSKSSFINDKSEELITLYKVLKSANRDEFFEILDKINHNWQRLDAIVDKNSLFFIDLYKKYSKDKISESSLINNLFGFIVNHFEEFNGMFSTVFNVDIENFIKELKTNLLRKIKRMKKIEAKKHELPSTDILDNIETALKSAFYMHFRYLYNNTNEYNLNMSFRAAVFLFIRNFAYSGMFRYNSKNEFNVPYGGIGYNKKNFGKKVEYLKSKSLQTLLSETVIESDDFEVFLEKHKPRKDDFIFVDPPYDSDFSTYAQNEFTRKDHERLAKFLIHKARAKWMLIIKNTNFIWDLYSHQSLNIHEFDKTYLVSFMNRNKKDTTHLLIRNY